MGRLADRVLPPGWTDGLGVVEFVVVDGDPPAPPPDLGRLIIDPVVVDAIAETHRRQFRGWVRWAPERPVCVAESHARASYVRTCALTVLVVCLAVLVVLGRPW